jgi:kinetochore protein NDC80
MYAYANIFTYSLSDGFVRRTSAYGGRPSLAGPGLAPQQPMKDPRKIRDKQWQYGAIRNLIQFLFEWGYEKQISPKILNAPSGKDFQMIFKFLYERLDPGYNWGKKKFEDEVPSLIKSIRFVVDALSPSHISMIFIYM